jgi:penicillin-binding protein 2
LDPEHPFSNWSKYDQGPMQLPEALQVSCDTVFYQWGAEFYDRWKANQLGAGAEPFQRSLRGFGFGHEPGIDLPSQADGLIPSATDATTDPQTYPDGWLPKDDILMSIGQGAVTVSPIQLASAYAAIANGGRLCEPRLAEQVQTSDGKRVRKIGAQDCRSLGYSQAELDLVQQGLREVVAAPHGTAASAFNGFPLSRVPVMGKTGTAERPGFQDTSWFAAIVGPSGDQHVIVAMVEQGGHGSTTAAPIVRSIIEDMYKLGDTGAAVIEPTD